MNLSQFTIKNYDKLEFIAVVHVLMRTCNLCELQAFRLALDNAKKRRIQTGFLNIYPEAWTQYTKFIMYNKNFFSMLQTLELHENQEFTE